jgi:predicted dinucleotide-binding enzyme
MKIGVFGTGMVGTTIGAKLVALGHEVVLGSRTRENEKAVAWARGVGKGASHGTFADAAEFGELLFNCTNGKGTLDALQAAGARAMQGKILLEVSNPLDFSKGMPPTLFVSNEDSLGERVQRAFPATRVVKTLNTVNCQIMVDPSRLPEPTQMFVAGNDPEAKRQATSFLREQFGWQHVLDLGDITAARGLESYLPLWVRMFGALGNADFNVKIVRAGG